MIRQKRITRKRIKKKSPPIDPRDLVESGHTDPCDMCYDAPGIGHYPCKHSDKHDVKYCGTCIAKLYSNNYNCPTCRGEDDSPIYAAQKTIFTRLDEIDPAVKKCFKKNKYHKKQTLSKFRNKFHKWEVRNKKKLAARKSIKQIAKKDNLPKLSKGELTQLSKIVDKHNYNQTLSDIYNNTLRKIKIEKRGKHMVKLSNDLDDIISDYKKKQSGKTRKQKGRKSSKIKPLTAKKRINKSIFLGGKKKKK